MNIKKILSFTFTFAFALTMLGGCFNKVPDLDDRTTTDPDQEYEFTGVVEPLEVYAYQQGTHQIEIDRGELIIIQSRDFDLNRYLEKSVIVRGNYAEVIGDAQPVLNVMEIEFEDGSSLDEFLDYENGLYGLSFTYPGSWELAEAGGGLNLSQNEYDWVTVDIYSDKSDLDALVSSQESDKGTPVTIGAQRSLRYLDGSSIRVYVPNPPKKKVYKIIFNSENRDLDGEKESFYDFLESLQLIYSTLRTGDKCGGKDNIGCEEGYRCELSSVEEDANGICVSINTEDSDLNCPFIPPPTDCRDYRIAEYSKATGCPTRYECVDSGDDLRDERNELNTGALTGTIEKYKDQILNVKGADIIQYELTDSEDLIAVIYTHDDKKFKTLYSFSPSANEFNFIEEAHFEEGDGRDWELISGEDTQSSYGKTVIKPSSGSESPDPRTVSSDMRLYENQHKDFSLEYPKNWYYRSFGAINNTHWAVGFADKSLDYFSDAIITVSIVDEQPGSSDFGYFTTRDRDDETVYVIEGPEDLKETVDKMADSIE